MREVIKTVRLTKRYNAFPALDELTLTIGPDVCVGFIGPNGAGKTTTIKILTSLIRSTSGKAFIEGVDVQEDPKKALMNVGSVVEIPEFYPFLTPIETLDYLGRLRGMGKDYIGTRSKRVLEQVRLEEWASTRIGKFSKGMKQRLAVAQALLHEPTVLILDEPTSGLDPRGMVEVREIIKELKKEKRTIFMSSHLLYEAQEVCDYVAMVDKGRLLYYDKVENVGKLMGPRRLELRTVKPMTEAQLNVLRTCDGVIDVEVTQPELVNLRFEGSEENRAQVLSKVMNEGALVVSFKAAGIELEDLYMQMMAGGS
ncbi:MAG: ABC transporter ATP-binding protein [Thermoplasmata archaeon]